MAKGAASTIAHDDAGFDLLHRLGSNQVDCKVGVDLLGCSLKACQAVVILFPALQKETNLLRVSLAPSRSFTFTQTNIQKLNAIVI